MQILQGVDLGAVAGHGADAAGGGAGSGKRGDAGNVVTNGGAADRFFVVEGFAAERRIDDADSTLPVLIRSTIFGRPSFTL